MSANIMSLYDLLSMDLRIPGYQRPYRWTTKNIAELLGDIDIAIAESRKYPDFKYRIGSVILHENVLDDCYDLVDGQQRMLSIVLISLCLGGADDFPLFRNSSFSNRETQRNIKENYNFISDWIGYQSDTWVKDARAAFSETLEAVVIVVSEDFSQCWFPLSLPMALRGLIFSGKRYSSKSILPP